MGVQIWRPKTATFSAEHAPNLTNSNNTQNNHLKQVILDYQGIEIHSVELIEEIEENAKPEASLLQILNIYNDQDDE